MYSRPFTALSSRIFRPGAVIALLGVLLVSAGVNLPAAEPVAANRALVPAAPARISEEGVIVRLKAGKDLSALHAKLGTKSRKLLRRAERALEIDRIAVPAGRRQQVIDALNASGLVEYAEPDYIVQALVEPNDFRFWDGSQWNLKNTGIYGGTVGADIDAPLAWDTRTSAAGVVVAVIDTGLRFTHEDLRTNLWTNPGESGLDANGLNKATNGIDDDGNSYVDDVHGINALNHSGNPSDDYGHGSHVAGVIGGTANNNVGIAGVAWEIQMMPLKFLDANGSGTISGAIECINYARAKGARVINASWGAYGFNSQALRDAIQALRTEGILFVAAAGNSQGNNDSNPLYPASYPYDNIISVAATTRTDTLASFSNWGVTSVDLAAPGSPIWSAWKGSDSDYRYLDGTSQAAPHVTAAAALIWAAEPTLHYTQVKAKIISSCDPLPSLQGKVVSNGRLNLARAYAAVPPPPPPPDTNPPPPPPPPAVDVVWVDDAIPPGAWTSVSGGDAWNWITSGPAPYKGTKSHQSNIVAGTHDHTFQAASTPMQVRAGDTLFVYVYIDPANKPREIMVSWKSNNWEHRAYWGENLITYGQNHSPARYCAGPMPAVGGWTRLEVPAASVALEGHAVTGMSFSLYNGRVAWDAAGKNTTTP